MNALFNDNSRTDSFIDFLSMMSHGFKTLGRFISFQYTTVVHNHYTSGKLHEKAASVSGHKDVICVLLMFSDMIAAFLFGEANPSAD